MIYKSALKNDGKWNQEGLGLTGSEVEMLDVLDDESLDEGLPAFEDGEDDNVLKEWRANWWMQKRDNLDAKV
jgi:hypothetical protein